MRRNANVKENNGIADETEEVGIVGIPAIARIVLKMMIWGVVGGLAGLLVGFFGPLVFLPSLPQGPLLGIVITGPVGVIIGVLLGAGRIFKKQ